MFCVESFIEENRHHLQELASSHISEKFDLEDSYKTGLYDLEKAYCAQKKNT